MAACGISGAVTACFLPETKGIKLLTTIDEAEEFGERTWKELKLKQKRFFACRAIDQNGANDSLPVAALEYHIPMLS